LGFRGIRTILNGRSATLAMAAQPAVDPPFNPLTGDVNDLILRHQSCWLWPEITVELQALAMLIAHAGDLLTPLHHPTVADAASHAAIGIVRTMPSIHQYAERFGSFATAARRLIASTDPALTDAQIYALLAIAEARTSAEGYCELATGIEEELARNAIGPDETDEIRWLRGELAQWEREQWRWSDAMRESAERFLLLAQFASTSTSSDALQRAEQQIVKLTATVGKFHGGRPKGAVTKFTRALMHLAQRAGSTDFDAVMSLVEKAIHDDPIEGIQFQDQNDYFVWYLDVVTGRERQTTIANLRRALSRLPAK